MKKIIILLFLIFLVTGCSSQYNLYISNDNIEENIVLKIEKPVIDNSLNSFVEVDDRVTPFVNGNQYPFYNNYDIVYDKNVIDDNNFYYVTFNYKYKDFDFSNSYLLNSCFEKHIYSYDKYYYFRLSGQFSCLYSSSMDINIKSDNKVIYNNADEVNKNVYTWHINSQNVSDVLIEMKIDKNNDSFYLKIFFVGLFIVIIVLLFFLFKFLKKTKSCNSI